VAAEALAPASLREEVCAAAAGARAAQAVAVVEREVGSGSVRDDCSAVPQAEGYCVPAAQAGSPGGESAQAGCSAESDGYSVELRLADSSRGGYSADSSPDGYLVAPPAADSLRGGYSADSSPDDCLVAPAADSPRGDYSVDSSQDDYSVVPPAADSSPGDYSADSSRDDY
jgi:hypothetical protein